MKYTEFVTYVRNKTRTNAQTLTDDNLVVYFNIAQAEIARRITKTDSGYFGIRMEHNLVAGQRQYAFDNDILNNMYYLEANIKPVGTVNDWKVLKRYNLHNELMNTDEDSIVEYMAGKPNGYTVFGGQLILLSGDPIISVTNGMRLWAYIYPSDILPIHLVSTADISIPLSVTENALPKQFHELLARRVIIMYKESQDKPLGLTDNEKQWEYDFQDAINGIKGFDKNEEVLATVPYDDGYQY